MNFEDNIKEKLEARRIEPTASAWDRIEGKLHAEEDKKKNKTVLWMAIAASFIAGIFLTSLFLNKEEGSDVNTDYVETPIEKDVVNDIKKPASVLLEINEETQIVSIDQNDKPDRQPSEIEVHSKLEVSIIDKEENHITKKKTYPSVVNTAIAQVEVKEVEKSEEAVLTTNLEFVIEQKITEAVASIDLDAVTDKEVDDLLRKAQREIISEQIFDTQSNRVDAHALLLDAEAEVDPATFKDKIFQTLKEGFGKAVEAVAARND